MKNLKRIILVVAYVLRIIIIFIIFFLKPKSKNYLIYADFNEFGGTKTFFLRILDLIQKYEYNPIIILSNNTVEFYNKCQLPFVSERIENPDYFKFSCSFLSSNLRNVEGILRELCAFMKLLNKYNSRNIVISVGNPDNFIFSLLLPVRVSYIVHTIPWFKIDNFKSLIINFSLSKNHQIVTVSDSARIEIINKWKIKPKNKFRIQFVYNYALEKKSNIKKANYYSIFTAGHLEYYKNPHLWIDIAIKILEMNKDKKVKFIWAGNGSLLNECLARSKNYNSIQFVGYKDTLDYFYNNSYIYFQPSQVESHGISVVEAMSYSLPCIVSDVGGLSESVIDGYNGFCINYNNIFNESIVKINYLLNNPEIYKKFAKNSIARYLELFTIEQWNIKMNKILFEN